MGVLVDDPVEGRLTYSKVKQESHASQTVSIKMLFDPLFAPLSALINLLRRRLNGDIRALHLRLVATCQLLDDEFAQVSLNHLLYVIESDSAISKIANV